MKKEIWINGFKYIYINGQLWTDDGQLVDQKFLTANERRHVHNQIAYVYR